MLEHRQFGFSSFEVGLVASGYFVGFLGGCSIGPNLVYCGGNSRAFAIFVVVGAISIIAHTIHAEPYFWNFARMYGGLAVAERYMVIESWFQAKATNKIWARVFFIYRIADFGFQIFANSLIGVLTPASYISSNILAMIMCLAIVPLAATVSKEPGLPKTNGFQPFTACKKLPLETLGVVVARVSSAAFGLITPLYATDLGMSLLSQKTDRPSPHLLHHRAFHLLAVGFLSSNLAYLENSCLLKNEFCDIISLLRG